MIHRRSAALILLLIVVHAGAAPQYKTRHVIIAVMDGVRWTESFGDPTHALIPHLYNELRPQGTLFTHFYNRAGTATQAAHSTILSGTWQCVPNGGPRVTRPTLFEYYRDQFDAPPQKTWLVFGPDTSAFKPYSSFPGYGLDVVPSYVFGSKGSAINDFNSEGDTGALAKVRDVMRTDEPAVLLVDFAYTDYAGHESKTIDGYKDAVKSCDETLKALWDGVQSDPNYRNCTTVFFTNDHGRHTNDWHAHNDACEGCQHVMFLALGPDIKRGAVIDSETLQIDIAPTAGELLGLQTPFSTGRVLTECLTDNLGLNQKLAVTPRAKTAQEVLALASRDQVRAAADYAVKSFQPTATPGDFSGRTLALGMIRAYRDKSDQRYLDWAHQWVEAHKGATDAPTQAQVGDVMLQLPEPLRATYLPAAKAFGDKLAAAPVPTERNAALATGAFLCRLGLASADATYTKAGQACIDAALALPWPADALPRHLAAIGEALSVDPRDADLTKAVFIAQYISVCWLKEQGATWPDPAASGLYACGLQLGAAALRLLPLKPTYRNLPAALDAITDGELNALFPDQPAASSRRLKVQMAQLLYTRGRQGQAFTLDVMRYGVKESGAYGDGSMDAQGAFLVGYKPLVWNYGGPNPTIPAK